MANTPKERKQWIQDELKLNPVISYTEMFAKYLPMFAKSKVTFDKDWKRAVLVHNEYQNKLNNAKDELSIDSELQSVKSGLKSKSERLMILQKQVDNCGNELELGTVIEKKYSYDEKEYVDFERPLSIMERTYLRKTIRELQSEISKIEGDYASSKIEHSGEIKTKTIIKWGNNEITI